MLNAIGNYLQQLPLISASHAEASAPASAVPQVERGTDGDSKLEYAPSARALLLSAVASDFDVRALDGQAVSGLQTRLLQYGLIGGRDLDAFSMLNTARADLADTDTLDALAIVDSAKQDFSLRRTSYTEQQQINRLHTLLKNLDSAHRLHA